MKVLLANPPWEKEGYFGVRAGSRWPHFERCSVDYQPFPFFLAIAAAVLEKHAVEVTLRDSLALRESEDSFRRFVNDEKPDIIFFEISTPSLSSDSALARRIHEDLTPATRFIFGGLHKPADISQLFRDCPFLSVFIFGEYEFTLREVIDQLTGEGDLSSIMGIAYRDAENEIRVTAPREPIAQLDDLPRPAYHQLPMSAYYDSCGGLDKPSVQLWASRGCPYGCIFCAWPQIMYGGRLYRTRDPVAVVDELEWLVRRYNFRSAYFDDDTFNIGKERILTIARLIGERKLDIQWGAMARADTMDRETLEIMHDNGLRAIKYGVESGNQSIIDQSGKRLDLNRVREAVQWTHELGIKCHLSFAFGLPGETWDTVRETVDLALSLDPTSLQFSLITPFPGSDYHAFLEQKGLLTSHDWQHLDGYTTSVVKTESLSSEDLEAALVYAEARWRRHLLVRMIKTDGLSLIGRAIRNPGQAVTALKSLFVR